MDIEQWLEEPAERLSRFWERHRVSVLGTLVFNLLVLNLLLFFGLQGMPRFAENRVFVGLEDPEYEEQPPAEAKPATTHTGWNQETQPTNVRNIAVDASMADPLNAGLNDEKRIDAQELYQEAARVREAMEANREQFEAANPFGEIEIPNTEVKEVAPPDGVYTGPSVLSYSLPGRKATSLPIPAYLCKTGGPVVVDILVNVYGQVIKATVDAGNSSPDPCLQQAAITAARASRFTMGEEGSKPQWGSITYMFVAQ